MKKRTLLLAVAPLALAQPAFAAEHAPAASAGSDAVPDADQETAPEAPRREVFSTGVAKGRDILDSAISTSSMKRDEVEVLGARSVAEVLRNIPGVRAEAFGGEGNASYSIRGLPLASSGSKFLQFQEDGLPVLEFGDIQLFASDVFMRVDSNLAQIEAIRGGSASTFSSNSPGGVINLMSKTGQEEGGSIEATMGINYGEYRVDFDYGGRLSDTVRYQVGGFYRQGEGVRDAGYSAYRGGQFKFNVTKELPGGYVRISGKYLDDRVPSYQPLPLMVSGTNSDPSFANLPNFDIAKDTLHTGNVTELLALDQNNNRTVTDARLGMHPVVKSLGVEAKYDIAGFTVTEKFRFSDISGRIIENLPLAVAPASALAMLNGGLGATLAYATGPNAGQAINPATVNGNGLLMTSLFINSKINSMDYMVNDLRASRVWDIGAGKFTFTAGLYKSVQDLDTYWSFTSVLQDVVGGGNAALVDVFTAGGTKTTLGGVTSFATNGSGGYHRHYDVQYDITAPYGSVNYHIGKVAIGASVRYDNGKVNGTLNGIELGGRGTGIIAFDMNSDGVISVAESKTAALPLGQPGLVDYDYGYLSYSTGINFRVSEPLAVFARYSKGGRAAADRVLFTPAINYVTGKLVDDKDAYDPVKQTEVGVKYRTSNLALNMTGFLADTGERNLQVNAAADGSVQVERIVRTYRAYGAEFEGSYRWGSFSVEAGATYTKAEITSDVNKPAMEGNTPRHQANLIYSLTPRYDAKLFSAGVNVVGQTSSFAQDTNQLKLPGYNLVNAFVQFRPVDNVQLMINANNLFDKLVIGETTQGVIPASGLILGRAYAGRTVSATARLSF